MNNATFLVLKYPELHHNRPAQLQLLTGIERTRFRSALRCHLLANATTPSTEADYLLETGRVPLWVMSLVVYDSRTDKTVPAK
jgi:hypothetical protein